MRIIHFSRGFIPAAIFSGALAVSSLVSYFALGGFNLGVDFQSGFIQELQFAPPAFTLTYDGKGDATVRLGRGSLDVVISGANVENATHTFSFTQYPLIDDLAEAMPRVVSDLALTLRAPGTVRSEHLVQSAQGKPELGAEPFVVHYLAPDASPIEIGAVRAALADMSVASVQILGNPSERRFLIRIDEEAESPPPAQNAAAAGADAAAASGPETAAASAETADAAAGTDAPQAAVETAAADAAAAGPDAPQAAAEMAAADAAAAGPDAPQAAAEMAAADAAAAGPDAPRTAAEMAAAAKAGTLDEMVSGLLQKSFGEGSVSITRSDFVGSRFSKQLAGQAGLILFFTLLLILVYASIRFRPQFAIGAVIALLHDALVMVAFITWTRMEFNTTTIAAILTALGYSINDTIVVFDRVRETRSLYPEMGFAETLDKAITETLNRTIITTVTTLLAVLALYVFTTRALYQDSLTMADKLRFLTSEHNSMKDFALALFVGISSGVYSTIFTACGWTLFWEKKIKRRGNQYREHNAPPATVDEGA